MSAQRVFNPVPRYKVDGARGLPEDIRQRAMAVPGVEWLSRDGGPQKQPQHKPMAVMGVIEWDMVSYRCIFCLHRHSTALDHFSAGEVVLVKDACHVAKGDVMVVAQKYMNTADMDYALLEPALPLTSEQFASAKHTLLRRAVNAMGPWSNWTQEALNIVPP